jgi:hypothetical protein
METVVMAAAPDKKKKKKKNTLGPNHQYWSHQRTTRTDACPSPFVDLSQTSLCVWSRF